MRQTFPPHPETNKMNSGKIKHFTIPIYRRGAVGLKQEITFESAERAVRR